MTPSEMLEQVYADACKDKFGRPAIMLPADRLLRAVAPSPFDQHVFVDLRIVIDIIKSNLSKPE